MVAAQNENIIFMCGSKRSLIACTLLLIALVAFIIYVAVEYHPAKPDSLELPYFSNDDSWGGTTVATGQIFPDRASEVQVNGMILMRSSPESGPYLRFESIEIEGPDVPLILILTGAPFPIDLKQRKFLPIELDGVPHGLFFKSGTFSQKMPKRQDFKGFNGAMIWNIANQTLVANVSFK